MENNRMIKALAVITPVAATTAYYLFKNREIPEPSGEAYQELPKLPYEKNPNKHIITKTPKTIGIIGAGISGLIGAKILKAQGYDVEVIEKNSGPGGVWYECYDGSGLQGDKYSYNLPDYQFSDSDPLYPKQPLIKAWIEKMLDEFDIRKLIRFNTEVVTITQNQDETWKVVFKEGGFKDYDFLIISTGICTRPNLPNINGIENFNGTVIHSSEFINAKKLCDGKKVIVVGGGKSAFDVMNASVDYGGTVTGVVKKIGHSFPFDSKPLGIPLGFTLCSRFYWSWVYNLDSENSFVHKYLRPIEYIFLKLAYLTIHWDAPAQMTPDDNHLHFRQTAGVRDPNTMAKLRAGQIQLAKGEIQEIRSNGVVVNGTLYEADTIVFATGYKSDYLIDKLKNDGLWTYRHMLIPGLRNLGLLGASLHYSPNLLTSIQAVWLADVLRGFVTVASVEEMIETTNKRKRENLQFYPSYTQHPHMLSSSSFTPYWIDELLKDMKLSTRREKTIFAHWFKEPNVSCYKSVVTHHI